MPPLLFEAAWNIKWSNLKRDLFPIGLFAIVGVLICVGALFLGLQQLAGASLATALLVGAGLSATDPVSVVALFRELGVDKRLTTLMEGESLFNDGVAVVAYNLLLGIALGIEQFDIPITISRFLVFVGIGLSIGGLIGFGISFLTQRFDLPLVEQSLTLVSAYGTYLVAEELGGSGVIAVVSTGLILGNFGSRIGMSPRTRLSVSEFWDFVAFFVNSIVFLLIGDQVVFAGLIENLNTILIAIVVMSLARIVSIFGLSAVSNWWAGSNITVPNQLILWWGGLRGSVSVALALSVPVTLADREIIIDIIFGVMLFTLLVQGLTTKPLLQALNLLGEQPLRQEFIQQIARRVALNRVMDELREVKAGKTIDEEYCDYQMALVEGQLEAIQTEMQTMQRDHPELSKILIDRLNESLVAIEADTYAQFIRAGYLKEEINPLLEDLLEDQTVVKTGAEQTAEVLTG